MTIKVPDAGLNDDNNALLENRTVAVLSAEIHALKTPFDTVDPFGTANITGSPSLAVFTVIVRSELVPAAVFGKSSVALPCGNGR